MGFASRNQSALATGTAFARCCSKAVRLEVVSVLKRFGRDEVGLYFSNYSRFNDWRVVPAWLDDREVLAVFRGGQEARPAYFIEIAFEAGGVAAIRDFFHVPYIAHEASFELNGAA